MKLELANGKKIDNPDQKAVNEALESLKSRDNDFAILGDDNYIQAAVTSGGFLMEYQDSEGHFNSSSDSLTIETVKSVFSKYHSGDSSWQNDIQWVPEEATAPCSCGCESCGSAQKQSAKEDDLFEELKGQAINWAKKKLRGIFS